MAKNTINMTGGGRDVGLKLRINLGDSYGGNATSLLHQENYLYINLLIFVCKVPSPPMPTLQRSKRPRSGPFPSSLPIVRETWYVLCIVGMYLVKRGHVDERWDGWTC